MKRLVIKIDLINEELESNPESGLARIFRGLASVAIVSGVESLDGVKLRDINGNTVGCCEIKGVQSAN